MTDQHRATPEQWEELQTVSQSILKMHAPHSCILELRDRVEVLEATYGSDASIPELSQSDVKAAEIEWARTAPGMRSDATDRVLALQDQIRDGALSLADALKEINGEPIERTRRTTYLVEKIKVKMIKEQKNSNSWQALADAVLREVAEWLRSEYPQREGCGTAWANMLDNEANL